MKSILFLISFVFLVTITSCGGTGGTSLVVKTPATNTPDDLGLQAGGQSLNLELGTPIIKDLYTVNINKSLTSIVEESGNKFLQLRSMGGTSSVGAFYGSGTGNKSFIGLGGDSFAGKLVSSFQNIKFKTRELASNPSGSYNVYLNILIDLNCDLNNPDYALVISDQTTTPGAKGNWYSFQILASDLAFKSVGGKGSLPIHTGATYAPLSALSTAFPLACFVAADVFDNGMKRHQKLSPFLIIHGDSVYSKASAVQVDDIELTVGTQTLTFQF